MSHFLILIVIIITDQVSKIWITQNFNLYESQEVIAGLLNITYVTNKGAAFSFLANVESSWRHYFFVCISCIALIGLTLAYYQLKKVNRYYGLALSLIAGGALGNLIDRLRLGSVVDFIDVILWKYHWPAFNVADSAICVGVGIFLLIHFKEERKKIDGE